jgi:hypothetical protein
LVFALAAPASGQMRFARPGELPPIDAAIRAAMVDSLATALDSAYVFPDTARAMISHVKTRLASGDYDAMNDPAVFLQAVQDDVLSVYPDKHFRTAALPPASPEETAMAAGRHEDPSGRDRLSQNNFGFRKAEILPGNIGYLELTQFAPADAAGETAVGAMQMLAHCDAVIMDLRRNGGGDASMIQLLASYFLEEPEHLVSWYVRMENETKQSWSHAYVPGKRMFETPLYILTSGRTGSAAEEFTYDLKNLERATVVGERTGGAAHTVTFWFYDFSSFRMGIQMPTGRAISPVTKTNWEGTGVEPNIAVPAERALATAQIEALRALEEKAEDEEARRRISWARTSLEAEQKPVTLKRSQLPSYAGVYGPRRLSVDGETLCSQREGGPRIRLAPMGEDLFKVADADDVRFRFARDERGRVAKLTVTFLDGREDVSDRAK